MSVTTTLAVTGMTCGHCVNAVRQELAALPGVHEVAIDLVSGGASRVQVSSDAALDQDAVAAAVDEAGYALAQPDR
jgi:copper chaperone CopZ